MLVTMSGCQTAGPPTPAPRPQLVAYQDRMSDWEFELEDPSSTQPTATSAVGEPAYDDPNVEAAIDTEVPDPAVRRTEIADRLSQETNEAQRQFLQDYLNRLNELKRPEAIEFTLRDVIERTLAYNYGILGSSYGPAIDAARIVQAEAAFDAVYFFNFTNNEQDTPSASQLASTLATVRNIGTGVRKLLATGTQAEISYNWTRTQANLIFQTLNPAYENNVAFTLRQPLLRGFGLDFNRAQINIRKNDRRISLQQFHQSVRDTLRASEEAYWRLVFARRVFAIEADLLYETEKILRVYEARARVGFDVYKAQLGQIRSRYASRQSSFIQARNAALNAEDNLKSIVNAPLLPTGSDVELIPIDRPSVEGLVLDRVAEMQAGFEHRNELKIARIQVESARIAIGVAKNQALPKLDLTFRYIVDGLGESSDDAFDQLTMNDFHEYFVGIEFEWPIGNRGPRAAIRETNLLHMQAIANVKNIIETIGGEIARAVWSTRNSYEQLSPNLIAAQAAREALEALQAREETKSPAQLDTELGLQDQVAGARRAFVQAIADYNLSIVGLEAAKGTLLRYYNVNLVEDPGGQIAAQSGP